MRHAVPRPALAVSLISLTGLVATSAPSGAHSGERLRAGGSAAVQSNAAIALHRAERALRAPGRGRNLTLVLSRLHAVLPRLSGRQAQRAREVLARPTDRRKDPELNGYRTREARPLCTAHFCIHYVRRTRDAPDPADADGDGYPDFVELVSRLAERSYTAQVGRLGWRRPRPDRRRGGSNATDIYLSQIGQGYFGYAASDPGQAGPRRRMRSRYTYMVIDNDFSRGEFRAAPRGSAAVTIAHEFNHVLQFTYDILQDPWMDESTATWMENEVFPRVNDYLGYVRGWARESAVPLTSSGFPKLYGSAVWNQWLAARYGPRLIRRAWEGAIHSRPPGFSAGSYDRAIRRATKSDFSRSFARFAASTAEWRTNRRFAEGHRFPPVRRAGRLSAQPIQRRLDHSGYLLMRVPIPRGRPRALRLGVYVGRRTRAAIALVGLNRKGSRRRTVTKLRFLPRGGGRAVRIGRPARFRRITAVLVNSDIRQSGPGAYGWLYDHNSVLFKARVSVLR